MSRLNVLVTGASNPIGERLIRILLADSRISRILAVCGTDPSALPLPREDRLQSVQVDLRRTRRVRQLLFGPAQELAIDTVLHLAMHHSAHDSGAGVHAYNVESLRSIIELSERHPTIRRLVIRSSAAVYQVRRNLPNYIEEDHPLNLHGNAPQWIRDRVEADVNACARMGMSSLQIAVLRMTEALAPGTGSQLYDYLESPVCLRPAGFDPMVNLLTIEDSALALQKAALSEAQGIFNIPGADTLPLSACIRSWGRLSLPFPDQLLSPLYRLRYRLTGHDFRYGMNRRRFLYSGVLDGERARNILGFVPCHPVIWPVS
jgi:UDP-glucose 4-epimerase